MKYKTFTHKKTLKIQLFIDNSYRYWEMMAAYSLVSALVHNINKICSKWRVAVQMIPNGQNALNQYRPCSRTLVCQADDK